jgi:hypothetical protein
MDKCFCHLNGYAVKDATARQEIESIKANYATKGELENIEIPEVDLEPYATKEEVDFLKPVILYANEEGENGEITLTDSAANYTYIEIYFKDNVDSDYGCEKFYNPNGKSVVIDITKSWYGSDSAMHCEIRSRTININGNSVTNVEQGIISIRKEEISSHSNTNHIYITRILGYK